MKSGDELSPDARRVTNEIRGRAETPDASRVTNEIRD